MIYEINNKQELEQFVLTKWNLIQEYLKSNGEKLNFPIYTSVDIRESKNKFAPVDNNIYPAGFNNICLLDQALCQDYFKRALLGINNEIKNIGIIPESHTKNLFYLDHLHTLKTILEKAGFNVEILTPDSDIFSINTDELNLISQSSYHLCIKKALLKDGVFVTNSAIKHDVYLLNNDQSSPLDLNWNELKAPVIPSPKVGWFRRQKIEHFIKYKEVADAFCAYFKINPNLIQAKFYAVEDIDFNSKEGLDILANKVDQLKSELQENANIFVKASQGTYGMGISVVNSGDEIRNMNRKARNKMDIGKNKIKFTKVLVQEGVETIIKYDDQPAEVTIYQIDGVSVGGFMRANSERDSKSNLNAKGMVYRKFCISELRANEVSDHKTKEAVYSVIAQLSTMASALEISDIINKG
jgi:glutamate--cysteine ligase